VIQIYIYIYLYNLTYQYDISDGNDDDLSDMIGVKRRVKHDWPTTGNK